MTENNDEHKVFDTPEEQCLHRYGMWLGSGNSVLTPISVFENDQFIEKELEIVPAVTKLIEEIINNSADEYIRAKDGKLRGWKLDQIKIKLNEKGELQVWDNGGITSKIHTKGVYPVELIFGQLFSSSNYDDTKERKTVGTNGVGSSLTNLFSNKFKATSADTIQSVEVTWTDNKSIQSVPIVTDSKEHFTLIKAELDLERFDLETLPFGIIKKIERTCIVLAAANPGLEVTFNDEVFKFDSYKEYVDLYKLPTIGDHNESWEFHVAPTWGTTEARRYAIVNGSECNEGTHIKHLEMIVAYHLNIALTAAKISNVTSHQINNSYTMFMNINIDQPTYADQAKTELTNKIGRTDEEGKWQNLYRSEKFLQQLKTGEIFTSLVTAAKEKDALMNSKEFKKRAKELAGQSAKTIRKLMDAGESRKSHRKDCELWIFEGDSAGKNFRTNRTPMTQGCYLLKGKPQNSLEMSTMKVMLNEEFSNIIVSAGLDPKNPTDISKLRFGKFIVGTDMDYDGFSIFGLFIAFAATHFPILLEKGMVYRAISPLWKATKGSDIQYFYSNEEHAAFASKHKGYSYRYFKGLGSMQKDDYKIMLQSSTLERYSIGPDCIEILHAFLGSDSAPRKRLLEQHV